MNHLLVCSNLGIKMSEKKGIRVISSSYYSSLHSSKNSSVFWESELCSDWNIYE